MLNCRYLQKLAELQIPGYVPLDAGKVSEIAEGGMLRKIDDDACKELDEIMDINRCVKTLLMDGWDDVSRLHLMVYCVATRLGSAWPGSARFGWAPSGTRIIKLKVQNLNYYFKG